MPNPVIKTDARQLVHRDLLDQLTTTSTHAASVVGGKKADSTQLDDLFTAANSDLIFPIRMIASDPVDLVITLDASTIVNTGTGRNRALYPMDDIVSTFAGGTVTFPATSAGNFTPSVGSVLAVGTSSSTFNKLGIYINSSSQIVLVEGTEGASVALSVAPSEQPGMTYVGYVDFGVDGGGNITDTASVTGQVINTDIFQFTNPTPGLGGIIDQDRGMKLLAGGNWSVSAGPVLNWDADAYVQVPGLANTENTVPLAASGIAIGTDQVAFVDINRIDTSITGNSTDLSGTLTVVDVDSFVPSDDRVIIAREDDGAIIVGDLFRLIVGEPNEQDRNLKLIEGGTWANAAANTLSWDADAYVQIPGQLNTRNTVSANPGGTAIPDGSVAYVSLNRTPGVAAVVTVTVDTISNVDALDPFILIIARGVSNGVIVGSNSFLLKVGQSEELESNLSIENRTLLGSGVTEILSTPTYSTRAGNAPQRVLDDSQGILDALASADIEIDKLHGQFRITAHETDINKVRISGSDFTMKDGSILSQEFSDFLANFDGAVINFTTGAVLETDDLTPLGIDFVPTVLAVGEFAWYSLSMVCELIDANNRAQLQLLLVPGAAAASSGAALFPDFSGDMRVGQVLINNDGGAITVDTIRQLGGGSSGSANGFTTVSISANQTLENRKHYLVDSTGGGTITLTLPSACPGFKIRVSDSMSNAGVDNIEIFPATGEKLELGAIDEEFLIDINDGWLEFTWDSALNQWQIDHSSISISLTKQVFRATTAAGFDALLPIAHAFGEIPVFMELWVDNGVDWEKHLASDYVVSDITNLKTTGTTLTSILGGATNIRFTAQERLNTAEEDKWETFAISAAVSVNAASRDEYLVDTSLTGGTATLVLPVAPVIGQRIRAIDAGSNASVNNIVIERNGQLIDGAAANFTINTNDVWMEFVFMNVSRGWIGIG